MRHTKMFDRKCRPKWHARFLFYDFNFLFVNTSIALKNDTL